jgi:hypothetical protein
MNLGDEIWSSLGDRTRFGPLRIYKKHDARHKTGDGLVVHATTVGDCANPNIAMINPSHHLLDMRQTTDW